MLCFIHGTGITEVGDEKIDIYPGITVYCPPMIPHRVIDTGPYPLEMLA